MTGAERMRKVIAGSYCGFGMMGEDVQKIARAIVEEFGITDKVARSLPTDCGRAIRLAGELARALLAVAYPEE